MNETNKPIKVTMWGETETVFLQTSRYGAGGGLYVALRDEQGTPYSTLSVNMIECDRAAQLNLESDEFFFKTWDGTGELPKQLKEQGVIEVVTPFKKAYGGHGVSALAYRLKKEWL